MSLPLSLGEPSPAIALIAGGALFVLVLWLGWRKPTWLLLLALVSLAIRPQLLWGGPKIGYEWGLHQTLIVLALAMNALHYGVRRTIPWPILALIASFALGVAFGNLHPKLTLPFMLASLAILALPFVFTHVVFEPGSRMVVALCIALTPLLSVALGGILQMLGIRPLFAQEWGGAYRLEGATGNAAVFATLAFVGFVVALHEATRPGRWYGVALAALNFVLVVLSATRMAVLASGIFVVAYALLAADLRTLWRAHPARVAVALAVAVGALAFYWPTLEARMFSSETGGISLSGREELWSFYYQEFLLSPVVGRGLGAGFIAASSWRSGLSTPHNEYLHFLVIGGVVGVLLITVAVAAWYRAMWQMASPNDRAYLLALVPALAVYVATDNLSFYTSALAAYAYLGVLLTRPSPVMDAAAGQMPEPIEGDMPGRPHLERS